LNAGSIVAARKHGWRLLALDLAAAEAVGALEDAGIAAILLKGPVIASRLYDHFGERWYGDVDLLVAPDDYSRAGQVLHDLGYRDVAAGAPPTGSGQVNFRREGPLPTWLDLHRSLPWYELEPARLWAAFAPRTRRLAVGGRQVEVLEDAALLLIIAGHAVRHGLGRTTREDLERAVERVERTTWLEAAALARQIGAIDVFATALRLVPGGAALLPEVETNCEQLSLRNRLNLLGNPPVAGVLRQLEEASSVREAAALVARELLPSPTFIRLWARREALHGRRVPLGAKGPGGLMVAYAVRAVRLVGDAPNGIRVWRRARRDREAPRSRA
jgi:hypothetical protein